MYELKYFSTLQSYSVQPADLKKVGNIFQLRLSPSYICHLIITRPFFKKKILQNSFYIGSEMYKK